MPLLLLRSFDTGGLANPSLIDCHIILELFHDKSELVNLQSIFFHGIGGNGFRVVLLLAQCLQRCAVPANFKVFCFVHQDTLQFGCHRAITLCKVAVPNLLQLRRINGHLAQKFLSQMPAHCSTQGHIFNCLRVGLLSQMFTFPFESGLQVAHT